MDRRRSIMAQATPKVRKIEKGGGWRLNAAVKETLEAVTVEPTYGLYCMVETISRFLHQAFLLDKFAYANLSAEPSHSEEVRRMNVNGGGSDVRAVEFVAFANSWLITPALFVTVFYTIFAISWSDLAGKRRLPLIFVPLFGLMLECAFGALHAYFWHWSVHWVLATYAFTQVAFGGRVCLSQSIYLYLADITTKENRTARYGLLMTVRFFALPLGYACAGLLLGCLGFFYSFLISFALILAATALTWALVADVSVPVRAQFGFWDAVNPKNSVESIRVLLKKRPQNTRAILAAMLLAFSFFSFTNEGELSVLYLYLKHRFHWNQSQISGYMTYRMFTVGVGTLVCSVILSRWLKMEDGDVGIFIGVARIIAGLGYLFANADWQLYVVALFDMYFAAGVTVTRSFATKLVASDELGRLAAVCSLTKISIPLSQPLYNLTFARTMHSLPSAFFLVSIFFALLILLLIGISKNLYRRQNSKISDQVLLSLEPIVP